MYKLIYFQTFRRKMNLLQNMDVTQTSDLFKQYQRYTTIFTQMPC